MKKICRRVLLLTAMLVLVLSVHAMADQKLYSARTITIPNQYGGGWSNQFTLPVRSTVSISINITGNTKSTLINSGLTYLLQNVSTGKKTYLSIPASSKAYLNYTLAAVMDAGTYSFGVYYTGSQAFKLHFSVYVAGGINIADTLQVMKGTTETVTVKPSDGNVSSIKIKSVSSSAPGYATVTYNNNVTPPTITVKGIAIGNSTITVYGQDGSYDTMYVTVTKYVPAPTLNYKTLKMSAGNKIYNAVENAVSTVTWSSSNNNVAKVSKNGRIRAVGYGTCVIRAKTVSNNKTYDLACTVKVTRTAPNFKAKILKYYAKKKMLKVKVQNLSNVPMVFYPKNSYVIDSQTGKKLRKFKLKTGKSVTIPKKSTKTFYIKLYKKLSTEVLDDYALKFLFKQDKKNYYSLIYTDINYSLYCLKNDDSKYYASHSGS